MKIGLIAPPWLPVPPLAYGGTEAVIDRLARGFVRAGHEVVLAAAGDSTCPVPIIAATPRSLGVGVACSEIRHLRRAYEGLQDCDMMHDHTLLGPQIAASTCAMRGSSRRTTASSPASGSTSTHASRIGFRSSRSRTAQADAAPDLKIARVIHHGLDIDRYPAGLGDGGYFLFLGRMAPEKGVHRAARVAREAGVRLLIAAKMSEPAEHRYFQEEVEPFLDQNVEYVGEVGKREKLALLAGARALVNPIRWAEPFGLVMIEALACGTPVLAFARKARLPRSLIMG